MPLKHGGFIVYRAAVENISYNGEKKIVSPNKKR